MVDLSHEKQIEDLHWWYCKRTGLHTKLFFSQRLWFDRLRDYRYDAAGLRADCELIIRHLKKEIARDKRNLGALKLSNFLQPDNFDSDLALARMSLRKRSEKVRTSLELEPPAAEDPALEEKLRAGAAQLRKFRQQLARESRE